MQELLKFDQPHWSGGGDGGRGLLTIWADPQVGKRFKVWIFEDFIRDKWIRRSFLHEEDVLAAFEQRRAEILRMAQAAYDNGELKLELRSETANWISS